MEGLENFCGESWEPMVQCALLLKSSVREALENWQEKFLEVQAGSPRSWFTDRWAVGRGGQHGSGADLSPTC